MPNKTINIYEVNKEFADMLKPPGNVIIFRVPVTLDFTHSSLQ